LGSHIKELHNVGSRIDSEYLRVCNVGFTSRFPTKLLAWWPILDVVGKNVKLCSTSETNSISAAYTSSGSSNLFHDISATTAVLARIALHDTIIPSSTSVLISEVATASITQNANQHPLKFGLGNDSFCKKEISSVSRI